MICPRCQGRLLHDFDELVCINCGYTPRADVPLDIPERDTTRLPGAPNKQHKNLGILAEQQGQWTRTTR